MVFTCSLLLSDLGLYSVWNFHIYLHCIYWPFTLAFYAVKYYKPSWSPNTLCLFVFSISSYCDFFVEVNQICSAWPTISWFPVVPLPVHVSLYHLCHLFPRCNDRIQHTNPVSFSSSHLCFPSVFCSAANAFSSVSLIFIFTSAPSVFHISLQVQHRLSEQDTNWSWTCWSPLSLWEEEFSLLVEHASDLSRYLKCPGSQWPHGNQNTAS